MSLHVDDRINEPHSVIDARAICENCGGLMVNDEVWGWLHTGNTQPETTSSTAP